MIATDGPEALGPHSLGMRGPAHKAAERERGALLEPQALQRKLGGLFVRGGVNKGSLFGSL